MKERDEFYYTEKSSVSGFPLTWLRFTSNGSYDCRKCIHYGDSDYCCECNDFGDSFCPRDELLAEIEREKEEFFKKKALSEAEGKEEV